MDGFPDANLRPRAVQLDLRDEHGQAVFVSIPLDDVAALIAKLSTILNATTQPTSEDTRSIAIIAVDLIESNSDALKRGH